MVDFVINERRREPRLAQAALRSDRGPQVPGARVIEVLDTSPRGLRCRLANPVGPVARCRCGWPALVAPSQW